MTDLVTALLMIGLGSDKKCCIKSGTHALDVKIPSEIEVALRYTLLTLFTLLKLLFPFKLLYTAQTYANIV